MAHLKPDFIICGVQKSGTTSLHKYLEQHQSIKFEPKVIEVHFFDNPEQYSQGEEEFTKHFNGRNTNKLIGQATSSYIYDFVPERIHKYTPDTKLIFILRNPVERAYSHYWHAKSKKREDLSFEKGLQEENNRIHKDYFHLTNYSYFSTGLYMKMIESFLKYFKKEQLHFVILEELKADLATEIKEITDFLGVDEVQQLKKAKVYNQTKVGKYKFFEKIFNNRITRTSKVLFPLYMFNKNYLSNKYPKMRSKTKALLTEKYKQDILELENFLGRKINAWRNKK